MASRGKLLVIGGDLGLRFGNLKKVDSFLFFWLNPGDSTGDVDLTDAAEDTSDMDEWFISGRETCILGERGVIGGITGESDASDLF